MVDLDKATKEGLETVKSYLQPEGFESSRSTKVWRMICLVAQIIVGCTFIFSSIMKGIDPVGTSIKLMEYGAVFGIPLSDGVATFFAVALNVVEGLLGFSLILGLTPRLTGGFSLLVMSGMTLLTLYIAIYNPVKDCGCFGDAITLSNTDTFIKNLILLPLVVLLWIKRSRWARVLDENWDMTIIIITFVLLINFNTYPLKHLPVIDFRPYKVGADLGELTLTGGTAGEYEYLFVYEKDGVERTFSMDELDQLDDSWTYVRDATKVIKEAQHPAGSDFVLLRDDGSNAMEQIAYDKGRAILIISPDFNVISSKELDRFIDFQEMSGESMYLAISNSDNIWNSERNRLYEHAFREVLFIDNTTAKTVIRSNPGIVIIDKGKIVRKLTSVDFKKMIKHESFIENPYEPISYPSLIKGYALTFGPFVLYAVFLVIVGSMYRYNRKKLRQASFNPMENKKII